MPKITRPDTNVQGFGTTTDGTGRTIYGSETQSDDLTANLSAEYLKGWNVLGQKPPRQWFNGALFTNSQLVSYLFQMGIPEWNANQEYYTNSKCTSPINGFTYVSKTGTAPSTPNPGTTDPSLDSTNWRIETMQTIGDQTIDGSKTFTSNPLSTATQSTNANALTKYSAVVKNTGNETIGGVKTFTSIPIAPTPSAGDNSTKVATTAFVVANAGGFDTAGTGLSSSGNTLNFYPYSLGTVTTTLRGSDFVVVSDSTVPKKITLDNFGREIMNASGSAPIYACRAWVNFNGTGTVAIRASGNVSSITDNGAGNYTVNFTTPMSDNNYCLSGVAICYTTANTNPIPVCLFGESSTGATEKTITSCRIVTTLGNGLAPLDNADVSVSFNR